MNDYKVLCLQKCDCGSECLELVGHGNRHETQHGCIFYSTESTPDRCLRKEKQSEQQTNRTN